MTRRFAYANKEQNDQRIVAAVRRYQTLERGGASDAVLRRAQDKINDLEAARQVMTGRSRNQNPN